MIGEMIGLSAIRRNNPAKKAPLALLLALGWVVALLALPSGPAVAATTFTVNDAADAADVDVTDSSCDTSAASGEQCTLRAAIEEANDTSGADAIAFDIGGTNLARTISPTSELPAITDAVTIDGYTQPGSTPNTLATGNDALLNVQLDGLNSGSGASGLRIEAPDCTIKGLVIKRFALAGIRIVDSDAAGNRIEGNFLGINRDGIADRGNGNFGVLAESDSNTIGGTDPASRNVISGNRGVGVSISDASDNRVEGNYVGTTADGDEVLRSGVDGVAIAGDSNMVGGTTVGARNVISGNANGVFITGPDSTENSVQGNYIGTSADGRGDLGNAVNGVKISSADLTLVGGATSGAANRIAHNGEDGVSVSGSDTTGNFILSNSIYSNGGLGIDLAAGTQDANGVTSNDADDLDTGPNNLQNFPVIRTATTSTRTGRTIVSGSLDSNPSQLFEVQCFLTDGAPATSHGEGSTLLATDIVNTDANGTGSFSCVGKQSLPGQVRRQTVSATATNLLDSNGDTSEFSKNKTITILR